MVEVWNRGGDISLEHARWHYYTIRDHVQGGICMTVPLAPLKYAASKYGLAQTPAANPYTWAFKGIINGLAKNQLAWGLDEPVDFIFDKRREEKQIREVWDHYVSSIPGNMRALTGQKPIFEDDKEVLPLQATDMWAWWCRRTWRDNGGVIPPDGYPIPWGDVAEIPQMILQWSAKDIETELARVASAVLASAQGQSS